METGPLGTLSFRIVRGDLRSPPAMESGVGNAGGEGDGQAGVRVRGGGGECERSERRGIALRAARHSTSRASPRRSSRGSSSLSVRRVARHSSKGSSVLCGHPCGRERVGEHTHRSIEHRVARHSSKVSSVLCGRPCGRERVGEQTHRPSNTASPKHPGVLVG
jgi:hypothetical protein